MSKVNGLIKLMRLELPISAGICVLMGQLFALGKLPQLYISVYGFLSVLFISASILVLNDYFDIETDKINAPNRPIPSNQVTKTEALYFSITLMILGITLSFLISLTVLTIAVILLIIGNLYNRAFKKSGLFGNLLVSISVGTTFIYGGASVGTPFNKVVVLFAVIAALIDLGEEIAADSMDVKGDILIDSNSIAIKFGKKRALTISSFIFNTVIIISLIPFVFDWFSIIYLIPIGIMDLSIGYSTWKLFKSENEEGRRYIRFLYLGSTVGLILFLVMRVLGV